MRQSLTKLREREEYVRTAGKLIRRLRIVRGLLDEHGNRSVVNEVARSIGRAHNTVLSWIRGATLPRETMLEDLERIVEALEDEAKLT